MDALRPESVAGLLGVDKEINAALSQRHRQECLGAQFPARLHLQVAKVLTLY